MSEAVMIALTKKGMNRQEVHELVRRLAIKSVSEDVSFKEVLLKDSEVTKNLSEDEIEELLNPRNYLGTAVEQVERCIEKTKKERRSREIM